MRSSKRPLWLLAPVAAGALGAGAALPPVAEADFATPQCQGAQAAGVGSSQQNIAQNGLDSDADSTGWAYTFSHDSNSICPLGGLFDAQNALFQATGSGPGTAAVCVNGTSFSTNPNTSAPYDFAAADDPPTPTQVADANNCAAAVSRPLELHTIPVAQLAIAFIVHLPTGCTIASADNASTGDRFAILNSNLQAAFFNGSGAPTWSTLLPNSPTCSGPITRVVRYDQAGTTFQIENYFAQIANSSTWTADAASSPNSESWPNSGGNIEYGGEVENPTVCTLTGPGGTPPATESAAQKTDCNGNPNVAQTVLDTPGSIGAVDFATAVVKGFQYPSKGTGSTFWIPVQNNGTGTKGATFADPNVNSKGYVSGNATGGSSCASASYTAPSGGDPTLSAWNTVFGSNPDQADYPLCALSYELLFNDNSLAFGDTAAIDSRARSVKDYIEYILSNSVANDGQNILRSLNEDALPAGILSIARTGANAITWSGSL